MGILWLNLGASEIPTSLFYIILMIIGALAYLYAVKETPSLDKYLKDVNLSKSVIAVIGLSIFVVGLFLVGSFLFYGKLILNHMFSDVWLSYIITTVCIVAPVEGIVFQFVMPKIISTFLANKNLPKAQAFGGIIGQIQFGVFHLHKLTESTHGQVTVQTLLSMGTIILLGIILYTLVVYFPSWGLFGSWGVHIGWNVSVVLLPIMMAFIGSTGAGVPAG